LLAVIYFKFCDWAQRAVLARL